MGHWEFVGTARIARCICRTTRSVSTWALAPRHARTSAWMLCVVLVALLMPRETLAEDQAERASDMRPLGVAPLAPVAARTPKAALGLGPPLLPLGPPGRVLGPPGGDSGPTSPRSTTRPVLTPSSKAASDLGTTPLAETTRRAAPWALEDEPPEDPTPEAAPSTPSGDVGDTPKPLDTSATPAQASPTPSTAWDQPAFVAAQARGSATLRLGSTGRRRGRARRALLPTMPLGPYRSAWTSLALPANPLGLTAGQATTPVRGGLSVSVTRISDERELLDLRRRRRFLESDGEINVVTAEIVSPRYELCCGPLRLRGHAWATLQSWTNERAIFDRLRNYLEEEYFGAGSEIIDNHDIGGKGITDAAGRTWLDSSPLLRAKVGLKLELPRTRIFGREVRASLASGASLPAFGSHTASSNTAILPEITLAWRTKLSSKWVLSGTGSVSATQRSKRMRQNGLRVHAVTAQASILAEYWITPRWSLAAGFTFATPWVRDSGYAFDTWVKYLVLGVQFRLGASDTLHAVLMENIETNINTRQDADVGDSQRAADFSVQLGWRHDF